MILNILDKIPDKLLQLEAHQLHEILSGPTLIHLDGIKKNPVFISVLLHGNEYSGWLALREFLLKRHSDLPRAMSIFIANVEAAKYGVRFLKKQPDYNRIWNTEGNSEELQMVSKIISEMTAREVFSVIDIHNTTGFNPHYACINRLDNSFKYFARKFSPSIIYFQQPDSVLSMAFSKLCPSVTIECGQPGDSQGIQRVIEFIDDSLNMDSFEVTFSNEKLISIFQTQVVIKIPSNIHIGFGKDKAELLFDSDLEQFNFRTIPENTKFAKILSSAMVRFWVLDNDNNDIFDNYFYCLNNYIYTRIAIIPTMITHDINIIKKDCLCYLMTQIM